MATDYNSVPLGQSGTGSAFVLGRSKAADSIVDTIDYNRKIAQQKAQQTAADWQKNALKVDGGLYWQPEFKQRYQQHLEKGIKLKQMGINPFNYNANDPTQSKIAEDYLLERQGILSDTDARKATEANVADQFKAFRADPDAYEPESFQELNDYINKPYSEASKGMIPQLRKRFDPNKEIVPKLDPVTFQSSNIIGNNKVEEKKVLEDPTKQNIETLFKSSNGGERYLKNETGLTISEAKKTKDTVEGNLNTLLREYKGNPDMRTAIARDYGITEEGEKLNTLLTQQAQQKAIAKQRYNSVIDQYYNLAKGKADSFLKVNPDYTTRQESDRREGVRQRNIKFAERGLNTEGVGTPTAITIPYAKGTASVNLDEYVPISVGKKNFAGSPYIDLATGKEGGILPSSSDYEVVGVGNAPIINEGNQKGHLSQPNFARENPGAITMKPIVHVQIPAKGDFGKAKDYFVPYDRLPENVKSSKPIREALSKFRPATQSSQPRQQPTAATKSSQAAASYSKAEENGINAVMKRSGATRQQVIEALKKAGKIK